MDLVTVVAVLSGLLAVGILLLQAMWGTLGEQSSRGEPTTTVATRPDLRPLPRPVLVARKRSHRAA